METASCSVASLRVVVLERRRQGDSAEGEASTSNSSSARGRTEDPGFISSSLTVWATAHILQCILGPLSPTLPLLWKVGERKLLLQGWPSPGPLTEIGEEPGGCEW